METDEVTKEDGVGEGDPWQQRMFRLMIRIHVARSRHIILIELSRALRLALPFGD